jgi:hypothetical protein
MTGTSPTPPGDPSTRSREIRDLLEQRVSDLVRNRIQDIESDTTPHQWRLARLLPGLIEEFGAIRSPEVIRGCADRILEGYDDARVRTHILTLATKQARDCLRKERCELLEASAE